jgi:NAD(P)-dependent dehydrogenase (short-subunit alcohol dehydrogenase family)
VRRSALGNAAQRKRCASGAALSPQASSGPLRVLITGSTKGLGRALADGFLAGGETHVLVNSRDAERVAETVATLAAKHGAARVCGFAADVAAAADVDALASFAVAQMGGVDVWINNAGSNGAPGWRLRHGALFADSPPALHYARARVLLHLCAGYTFAPLTQTSAPVLAQIVATNLLVRGTLQHESACSTCSTRALLLHVLPRTPVPHRVACANTRLSRKPQGTLLCSRAACLLMSAQPGGGCVFSMEGAGSDGGATQKYAAYGASKAALPQLWKSLAKEMELAQKPIAFHSISPGMVQTDLIDCGAGAFGASGLFFINAFSEPPEVPAAVIVQGVLALAAQPRTAGPPSSKVTVLTPLLALQKIAARLLLGTNKSRWYKE